MKNSAPFDLSVCFNNMPKSVLHFICHFLDTPCILKLCRVNQAIRDLLRNYQPLCFQIAGYATAQELVQSGFDLTRVQTLSLQSDICVSAFQCFPRVKSILSGRPVPSLWRDVAPCVISAESVCLTLASKQVTSDVAFAINSVNLENLSQFPISSANCIANVDDFKDVASFESIFTKLHHMRHLVADPFPLSHIPFETYLGSFTFGNMGNNLVSLILPLYVDEHVMESFHLPPSVKHLELLTYGQGSFTFYSRLVAKKWIYQLESLGLSFPEGEFTALFYELSHVDDAHNLKQITVYDVDVAFPWSDYNSNIDGQHLMGNWTNKIVRFVFGGNDVYFDDFISSGDVEWSEMMFLFENLTFVFDATLSDFAVKMMVSSMMESHLRFFHVFHTNTFSGKNRKLIVSTANKYCITVWENGNVLAKGNPEMRERMLDAFCDDLSGYQLIDFLDGSSTDRLPLWL